MDETENRIDARGQHPFRRFRQWFMSKIERRTRQFLGCMTLFLAWVAVHTFKRGLLSQDIWLICEKRNEARDNGYHFFRYLRTKHPEINSYYVITKDSSDSKKVEVLGNVIEANSWKHCLYYIAAVKSVSSQAYGAFPFNLNQKEILVVQKLCNKRQKTVFLQHGIIKDELAHSAFDYDKNNIDFFVCSAKREYEFVKGKYGYPDGSIGCIGMCRFDNLTLEKREKMILIMPTWREWLKREKENIPLAKKEIHAFKADDFYKQYSELLADERLTAALRKSGYKLFFYLHYQLQDYTPLFAEFGNDVIHIADRFCYDVQDLLLRAAILVTDFSSVFFDFAYMNKPLFYFQFDKQRFVNNHYAKGYFDYERDGFGPCVYEAQNLISELLSRMEHEDQPEIYSKRVDTFFTVRDKKNCERTFEVIQSL